MRTVAALFVDKFGPYPHMPGVECWDETRDAREYAGPHPVVAHPPCGPWSRMKHFCRHQDPSCGPAAVRAVQQFGGCLEHPADSKLFDYSGLPKPGAATDGFGGRTYSLDQCDWGHVCRKTTWLYVVRADQSKAMSAIWRRHRSGAPKASVCNGRGMVGGKRRATAAEARLTPPAFAEFLVSLARQVTK